MPAHIPGDAATTTPPRWQRDAWLFAAALAGIVVVALYAHVRFSMLAGEPAFFKGAFDEDTYALYPLGFGLLRLDRLLSGGLLTALFELSAHNADFVMIACDALLVPLAFLAAFFAATQVFRAMPARLLLAAILVFSPDLFSLGSLAANPPGLPSIDQFRGAFGALGETLVPAIETSYLTILRSPDPQASYVVAFLFLGLLVGLVLAPQAGHPGARRAGLVVVQVLLTLTYTFISLPLLLLELYVGVVLVAARRRRDGLLLLALAAGSLLAQVLVARLLIAGDSNVVFHSRLPVITTSAIAAVVLVGISLGVLIARRFRSVPVWVALGCSGLPLALLNQQLVTGVMISTRDWERYINWPLLVVGAALLLAVTQTRARPVLTAISLVAVVLVVGRGVQRSYEFWLPINLDSLAAARAIAADPAAGQSPVYVLTTAPDLAPLIRLRAPHPIAFILDYSNVFLHPVLTRPDGEFLPTPLADSVFDYWRVLGRTPEQVQAVIEGEVAARGGFYSGFLFNICDYWYPCTDSRAVQTTRIAAMIPQVVAAYAARQSLPEPRLLRYVSFSPAAGAPVAPGDVTAAIGSRAATISTLPPASM